MKIEIINNYDKNIFGGSESTLGFEIVKDRDKVPLGASGCCYKEQSWKI